MIKAVIFDMDGTLLDTEKYYIMFWPKALEHFGYKVTREQVLTLRSLGRPYAPEYLKKMVNDPNLDYEAVRSYRRKIMEEYLKDFSGEIPEEAYEFAYEVALSESRYIFVSRKNKTPAFAGLSVDDLVREQEGKQEDERKDRRNGADILVFTRAQFDDRVGNETSRDAVRNGIRKGHHGDGQERGDSRRGVFPIDIDDVSHHQNADVHQSARRSRPSGRGTSSRFDA